MESFERPRPGASATKRRPSSPKSGVVVEAQVENVSVSLPLEPQPLTIPLPKPLAPRLPRKEPLMKLRAPKYVSAIAIVLLFLCAAQPQFALHHEWTFPTLGLFAIVAIAWLLISSLRMTHRPN
jgi:hypothetical protein